MQCHRPAKTRIELCASDNYADADALPTLAVGKGSQHSNSTGPLRQHPSSHFVAPFRLGSATANVYNQRRYYFIYILKVEEQHRELGLTGASSTYQSLLLAHSTSCTTAMLFPDPAGPCKCTRGTVLLASTCASSCVLRRHMRLLLLLVVNSACRPRQPALRWSRCGLGE